MTAPIVLVLPYPPSANHYNMQRVITPKGHKKPIVMFYLSQEAKDFIAECQRIALGAGIKEPLTGRLELAYRLYPHRPQDWQTRMRKLGPDWDDSVRCIDGFNAEKVMADSLQGIVYENDNQVWKGVWERMEPDEHGARLVVFIRPIPPRSTQQALT